MELYAGRFAVARAGVVSQPHAQTKYEDNLALYPAKKPDVIK